MPGNLYLVSTPIGNLDDITFRAVKTLKDVDIIACEDTRNTKKLLSRYNIKNELVSYHEHNEAKRSEELFEKIKSGKNIAIVSDAGTPCISDPGFKIVRLAVDNDINVIPVPGASALICALAVSGFSTESFSFFGFFPRTRKNGMELLGKIKNSNNTTIFYESPKRVLKTLNLLHEVLGNRQVSVSREITKMYEETLRGPVRDVVNQLEKKESIKGEFVLVIEGLENERKNIDKNNKELDEILEVFYEEDVSLKTSVEILSKIYDSSRNDIYEKALNIWNK